MTTNRTTVHRASHKQVFDPVVAKSILARAIIAHVAINMDGQPYSIPVACAPYGDELLLHGSTASRLFKALSEGTPACVTITLVDALVLARSSFESSMHYHSLMALGRARLLRDEEKRTALNALTDHLFPERRSELRESSAKEIRATAIVAFPMNEMSVKVSNGEPNDPKEDLDSEVWAGIVPLVTNYGPAMGAANLKPGIEPPEYLSRWPQDRL